MTATPPSFDVAVIGLGAMGAATAYQLARRGVRVVGFDRHAPPHAHGSSHGDTRITRQAIGEGLAYVPLVLRAHAIWDELAAATGVQLIERCGFLAIAAPGARDEMHGKPDFVGATIAAANAFGIEHQLPSAAEARQRFPQFDLRGDEICYFEPGGGYVFPERCIAVQLAAARQYGADLRINTQVTALRRDGAGIAIVTPGGIVRAARAIVAAGAWVRDFCGAAYQPQFSIYRQSLNWFPVTAPGNFRPGSAPVFIWAHGPGPDDQFYGFPPLPGEGAMKCAAEVYLRPIDPDSDWQAIDPGDAASLIARHATGRIKGIGAAAVRSTACIYTVTPDGDFAIGALDDLPVTLVSACSGHGFKHSAAIGEALAQQFCGQPSLLDGDTFALRRFSVPRR